MKWEQLKVVDVCELAYGKSLTADSRISGEYPVYGSAGEVGSHINYLIDGPGIIIGRKGSIGTVYYEKRNFFPIDTSYYVIPKDGYDLRFLYYKFQTLGLNKLNSDAAVPGLNRSVAYEQSSIYPPLPTQRRIASILSAYDDLIENNLKRIKLLEEKAFLRYKQIVREEKVVEERLYEVVCFLKRGISPKYVYSDGIVVLNQKCIRNHIANFTESRLTDSEKKAPEERMLQKFDTLINSTGTGTLGRIAMNIQDEFPVTADSHITIVRSNGKVTPIYLCMSLFSVEKVIEMMGEGSTNQTELSPKKLGEEVKVPIVSISLMNEFEKQAECIFDLIWNLQKQNTKLREARDILLPRLMDGSIEV